MQRFGLESQVTHNACPLHPGRVANEFAFEVSKNGIGVSYAEMTKAKRSRRPFEIILVDAHLCGADGFALASALKKDAAFDEPEIVVLTSFGMPGETAQCHRIGAVRS